MNTTNIPFKWAFMGSGYFAREVLQELYLVQFFPDLVITTPDKPAGRGLKPTPNPVKDFLSNISVQFVETPKVNTPEIAELLRKEQFDFLVVCDFGKILKKDILQACKFPAINIHPSLLPAYRGAAPIERCLLNGEQKTGITIIEMTEEIDAGPVLAQTEINITKEDTRGTLMEKLSKQVPDLLKSVLFSYLNGTVNKRDQQGTSSYAPKVKKSELFIDWRDSALNIFNKIRAFSPTPGARTLLHGSIIKIFKGQVYPEKLNLQPGEIKIIDNEIYVGTRDLPLKILELQPAGKRIMRAKEFVAGRKIDGEFFEIKEVLQ
ncbi:MAG: methionyl-tRNA formyltransferase [candidate division WOR-3 bacterium]